MPVLSTIQENEEVYLTVNLISEMLLNNTAVSDKWKERKDYVYCLTFSGSWEASMDYTTYALERIQYPCDIVSTAPWVVKSCDMIPGSSSYSTRVFIYGFEKLIVGDTAVI